MRRSAKNLRLYKNLCKAIWEERGPHCQDCGTMVGTWDTDLGEQVPHYHNFHHTEGRVTKALDKDSIKILCYGCHSKDHGLITKNTQWLR